jgi:uncharacterized protein YaaW (UPF0174 family)
LTSFYLKNEGKEKKKILLDILHHLKAQMVNYEVKASAFNHGMQLTNFFIWSTKKTNKNKIQTFEQK